MFAVVGVTGAVELGVVWVAEGHRGGCRVTGVGIVVTGDGGVTITAGNEVDIFAVGRVQVLIVSVADGGIVVAAGKDTVRVLGTDDVMGAVVLGVVWVAGAI